jgi:hypothetical protein
MSQPINEGLKIFTKDFEDQFQPLSHIKEMKLYKNKMIGRRKNLKSLKRQGNPDKLADEPMFPIYAEKVL